MFSVRSRRLPPGVLPLIAAVLFVLAAEGNAAAFDNLRVLYGLHEYAEYTDNLFSGSQGKIQEMSVNTVPDLSILYDDGETRWLARGNYHRESFPNEQSLSGDYFSISGEIARDLNDRHTFSILGGYTVASSIILGRALTEPGQLQVLLPDRGSRTEGTAWSPALSSFWSRRFATTLTYGDIQTFTRDGNDQFGRSLSLSGAYVLSPSTVLNAVLLAGRNLSSGTPLADEQNANTFTARFGFSRVMTPRLTLALTAGPQWTREYNLPDRVTLLRNALVKNYHPSDGTFEQEFMKEPGTTVEDTSVSLSFTLGINYQIDRRTWFSLDAIRSTNSGQGVNGTFEENQVGITLDRELSRRWHLSIGARTLRAMSIARDFSIQSNLDPDTGERVAQDNASFDVQQRVNLKQIFFEPRLDYQLNRRWTAYIAWNHNRFDEGGGQSSSINVNRVLLGLQFRDEARF